MVVVVEGLFGTHTKKTIILLLQILLPPQPTTMEIIIIIIIIAVEVEVLGPQLSVRTCHGLTTQKVWTNLLSTYSTTISTSFLA